MDQMEPRHRLVQFTDTHLLADPQGWMRGVRSLPALQACKARREPQAHKARW